MGVDVRPPVGRRLAFVIEARPGEAAGHEGAVSDGFPGPFRQVVGRDKDALFVVGVLAARSQGARRLAAEQREGGVLRVELVIDLRVVVDPHQVLDRAEAGIEPAAVHRAGNHAGRVVFEDGLTHGFEHGRAGLLALLAVLFICHRPHNNAGVVAVAPDHARHFRQVVRRVAQVSVLVHDQHPQPVAGVQQFGRGRVVRHAPGVAAHLLELRDAPGFQRVRDGDADARKVLVVARPLNLDRICRSGRSPFRHQSGACGCRTACPSRPGP